MNKRDFVRVVQKKFGPEDRTKPSTLGLKNWYDLYVEMHGTAPTARQFMQAYRIAEGETG